MDEKVGAGFRQFYANDVVVAASLKEYDKASSRLLQIYADRQYSAGVKESAARALRAFRKFLQINSFQYSHQVALAWLSYLETQMSSRSEYNSFRKVLLSVHEIMSTGSLKTRSFSSQLPKYPLLDWQNSLLDEYLAYRTREECAASTQRTVRASCSRFFSFLNDQGVKDLCEITPELLKQYHLRDKHTSVRGKNLYSSQLRLFLRYLGKKEFVPNTLELAVSCQSAPSTKLVKILSAEQTDAIYTYRENAETPLKLRDSAFFMLGMRMGLRGADIVRLKFSDISWEERTISFVQQKTGVFLKLPMPIDVGNSLFRYIQEGRLAQAHSEYVFVRHMAPFDELSGRAGISKRLKSAILQYLETAPDGFHVTRRTYASNLLKGGNPIPTIASALGHANFLNVHQYLSTDEKQLRKCAIDLNGIEYTGGYGL